MPGTEAVTAALLRPTTQARPIPVAEPNLDLGDEPSADLRAVWGQLHLGLALAHAKAGRGGKAWHHWDQDSAVARGLGETYHHPWLMYGVAAVDIYRVTIETDLARFGEAETAAAKVQLRPLPSHTRRAFFLLEQARQRRSQHDDVGVIYYLTKALEQSQDTARHHPVARAAAAELVARPGIIGEDARELALVIGLDGDGGYVG